MQTRFYLVMVSVLAILVAMGAVANTASAIENCRPKTCCYANTAAHGATGLALTGKSSDCNGNSPCCQLQPSMPFPDMALIASSQASHPKMGALGGLTQFTAVSMQQTYFSTFFDKEGHLKIPRPPLYLQKQAFLC